MEEEAIITAVRFGPKTTIGESLELEFLYVSFRVLRRFKYEDKVAGATLTSPSWLSSRSQAHPSLHPRRRLLLCNIPNTGVVNRVGAVPC